MAFGAAVLVNGTLDGEVTAAATIEVDQRLGVPTRYRLELPLTISSGDLPLLSDDRFGPGAQIAVVAETGNHRGCLVWGPVTGQRISLVHGGSGSSLSVEGADATIELDRDDRVEVWADVSDGEAVETIAVRKGFTPDIQSTNGVHAESRHTLVQRETDLDLLQRLARRRGYVVWLTSTEDGQHTLHFRPRPTGGDPAAELWINRDPSDGRPAVESLELWWDLSGPTTAVAHELDGWSKEVLDGTSAVSPTASLGAASFADLAGAAARSAHLDTVADDVGDLTARSRAVLAEASFFISAAGSTTTTALGDILQAPSVVTLSGAGSRHSGSWLCTRVRHVITDDTHTMHFELARDGWGIK